MIGNLAGPISSLPILKTQIRYRWGREENVLTVYIFKPNLHPNITLATLSVRSKVT